MRDPLADPQPLIRRVYGYVAYRVGDGPDAEDVTSETFERALRYRESFDPRRGEPASWLIGIARRCIADAALRGATPTAEVPERAGEGHEETALQRLELAPPSRSSTSATASSSRSASAPISAPGRSPRCST